MKSHKNINYNYAFIFYDIKDNKESRGAKLFKVCKKYFTHHQKSIFRGEITPSNLIALREEIKKVINHKEDFVSILKFKSKNDFNEEVIGINKEDNESIFI